MDRGDDTITWFGENIPPALRRRSPTLDDSMPEWLRDLVASRQPVDGCRNLFFTESLPIAELGDDPVE